MDPKISSMQERLNKINEELDEIISVEEAAAEALATSEAAKAAVEEVAKAAEMTEAKPAKKKTKKEEANARAKISDTISSSMQGAPEARSSGMGVTLGERLRRAHRLVEKEHPVAPEQAARHQDHPADPVLGDPIRRGVVATCVGGQHPSPDQGLPRLAQEFPASI